MITNEIEFRKKYVFYAHHLDIYYKKHLKLHLEEELEKRSINIDRIIFRLKSFESFARKLRKKISEEKDEKKKTDLITNPFSKIRDVGGIRIVIYTKDDYDKIHEVIEHLFEYKWDTPKNYVDSIKYPELLESEDDKHKIDRFGYRSRHFEIFKVKDYFGKWEFLLPKDPDCPYSFELQVCTINMHAWACFSHDTIYKPFFTDIEDQFSENEIFSDRQLYALSAIYELIDDKIENILATRERRYNHYLKKAENNELFDEIDKNNFDAFRIFLDYYFHKSKKDSVDYIANTIFDEFVYSEIDYDDLLHTLKQKSELFNELRQEKSQVQLFTLLLFLTSNSFLEKEIFFLKHSWGLLLRTRTYSRRIEELIKKRIKDYSIDGYNSIKHTLFNYFVITSDE